MILRNWRVWSGRGRESEQLLARKSSAAMWLKHDWNMNKAPPPPLTHVETVCLEEQWCFSYPHQGKQKWQRSLSTSVETSVISTWKNTSPLCSAYFTSVPAPTPLIQTNRSAHQPFFKTRGLIMTHLFVSGELGSTEKHAEQDSDILFLNRKSTQLYF